jgi:septum formation protein
MMVKKIILASQSPRRKQLLKQIGIEPICKPVDIDESVGAGEQALDYCMRLALEKAQAGWQQSDKSLPVLGSDTIVVLQQQILGKPANEQQAYGTLMNLSGKSHQVITAVAMVKENKQRVVSSISTVTFDTVDEQDVRTYIATKEPMDKAGSYGIQGFASIWIKHISGSHSGIMGLPLYETHQLLKEFV